MVNNCDSFDVGCIASHTIVHIFRIIIIILKDRKESLIVRAFLHMLRCGQIMSRHLNKLMHHFCIVQCQYELFETFIIVADVLVVMN